nr:hypothetical protein [Tanacetum cinerariifolium]
MTLNDSSIRLSKFKYNAWKQKILELLIEKHKVCWKIVRNTIFNSIWNLTTKNGPTPHPQTPNPAPEGGAVPPPRNKRDEEFTEEDNRNELADIQAINILSQGLLRHIFNILNQNETGREILVNLELLMKGSGQTLERRKKALFDEFECFRANGNELIQDYFVCFHKTYEEHALKSLKKKEQSSAVVDPLAYLDKITPTHSTTSPVTVPTPQSSGDSHNDAMLDIMNQIANLISGLQKQFPPTNNQLRTSSNPKTHATVHDGHIFTETVQRRAPSDTGTKGIQTTGSGVNYSGKKVICYNCRGEGHVARQCKEPKRACDSQWYHDKALLMQAKDKRAVLNAEAKAFLADVECTAPCDQPLALTTTNLFEANQEDAYDSNMDEGPHAFVAFMANLASIGGTNGSSSSHINEVQIIDDSFFGDVSYPLVQEMQQKENLNSEVDSVLDDNMITYDEYQNNSRVEAVLTVVSADEADKQSMIAVSQRMHTEIAGYVKVNDEHKLVNATLTTELEWCKIEMQALERNKVKHDLDMAIVERNKRNAELEEENVMLKSTLKSKVVSIENLQQESKQDSGFKLTGFLDADYAGCKDTIMSTSGGAQFLGEKLMRTQLTDYGFQLKKIPIYCDSKSTIAISCNSVQHSRTKHIAVCYHFIKEYVEKGTIELYFVKTDYQLADIFTKALPIDRFNYLVRRLGELFGNSVKKLNVSQMISQDMLIDFYQIVLWIFMAIHQIPTNCCFSRSYKAVEIRYIRSMIQPEPKGSTMTTPLDRVEVIGSSHEVSVSTEGVKELKRIVRINGEKKEALHTTLGRNWVKHNLSAITKMILILKTSHHGPSDAMHSPP